MKSSILIIVGAPIVAVVIGGGWYFLVREDTQVLEENVETPQLVVEEVDVLSEPEPLTAPITERRDLTVSYELKVLASFSQVTESVARDICAITAGAGVCAWGTTLVTESGTLAEKVGKADFSVTLVPADAPQLLPGLQYHIEIRDPSGFEPKYRMFVVHKDLLDRVDGVYEARITAETVPHGTARVFEWYLQEKHINESGEEEVGDLRKGHYQIAVVDAASGRVSGISKVFVIGPYQDYKSDTTRFGANTPLAHSRWSGKGVFFDGRGGEDIIELIGDKGMYDIFKGVDFPEYADTLIFLQGGSVVITTVNVEIVKFDDVTIKVPDLIAELSANGGAIYRTKKFDVKK